MRGVAPFVYGVLRLTPEQFGRMTPREFEAVCQGHRRQDRAEWYRTAWMVSYLLQPHAGNKTPSPERLLGWVKRSRRSPRGTPGA